MIELIDKLYSQEVYLPPAVNRGVYIFLFSYHYILKPALKLVKTKTLSYTLVSLVNSTGVSAIPCFSKNKTGLISIFFRKITLELIFWMSLYSFVKKKITK